MPKYDKTYKLQRHCEEEYFIIHPEIYPKTNEDRQEDKKNRGEI